MADEDLVLDVSAFEARDIDAVLEIEHGAMGRPWTQRQFLDEIEAPFSGFLVARSPALPGQLAGFVLWRVVLDEFQIFNVAVHPQLRRRGIGHHLLQHALAAGTAAGAVASTLEVHCQNEPAVALYRALGFTEVGRRRDYYGRGQDALLLERALQT